MPRIILVPHDGHSMSDKALRYAMDIAKHMDMEMQLLRIIPKRVDPSDIVPLREMERTRVKKSIKSEMQKIYDSEYSKLEKIISLASSNGVEAKSLVVEGDDPGQEIVAVIRKRRPYIVVMGSRRLQSKGLSRLMVLGSAAKKVAENSSCPVLLVR